MVEHSAVNRRVASSNLARGANFSFLKDIAGMPRERNRLRRSRGYSHCCPGNHFGVEIHLRPKQLKTFAIGPSSSLRMRNDRRAKIVGRLIQDAPSLVEGNSLLLHELHKARSPRQRPPSRSWGHVSTSLRRSSNSWNACNSVVPRCEQRLGNPPGAEA